MKKMNFKSESGFTLMELMVVIGVLAILIAILLPQFTGYTAQAQAISAASEAKNALTAGYSYYVSVTSRGTGTGASASTFNPDTAKARMEKAAKTSASGGVVSVTDATKASYSVKKGDLTFTTHFNLSTGSIVSESDSTQVTGTMVCEPGGQGSVCADLEAEGALKVQ